MERSKIVLQQGFARIEVAQAADAWPLCTFFWRGKVCAQICTEMQFQEVAPVLAWPPKVIEHRYAEAFESPLYTKRAHCALDVCDTTLDFGEMLLHFHLSEQGVAYHWETHFEHPVTVLGELFDLTPPRDAQFLYGYHNLPHKGDAFQNSWESVHHLTSWKEIEPQKLIYLPLTVLTKHAALSFTEAELFDYPGLNIQKSATRKVFEALMAPAPKTVDASGRRYAFVLERHPYLVQTQGRRTYPWRICMMADSPAKLYENDLPYILSRPPAGDFNWVQAGRVAWEWWNAWGLQNVPFTPGVNTATYKAYIDFASAYGIPYVILDEGWAKELDVTEIIPEIDLPELIRYAGEHHVKLILWCSWPQLIDRQEALFNHYAAMGIAGFKIDFFDRDDVAISHILYETAEIAARYHLVLAYHGIHKPTGLSRTYHNVLTYEGVFGLENTKWTTNEVNFVQNDVRLAFARLLAGPTDYTPGAMTNRHRADFQKDFYHPMSMGTRCHQAALFVLYDTALQMLCDSPSAYTKEAAYTHFLASIPLLWDETIALPYSHPDGCLAALRRKGNDWYFAVLNNDQARIITLPTWYLPQSAYLATALVDGDTKTNAQAYRFEEHYITPGNTIDLHLAAGGGCIVYLKRAETN